MYHQVDTSGNNPHYFRTVFVFRAGSREIWVTIESIGDGMVPFNLISRSLAVMGGLTITCLILAHTISTSLSLVNSAVLSYIPISDVSLVEKLQKAL